MASLASTVIQTVTQTVNATASSTASSDNRAPPQGGVFEGVDPTRYNTRDPIVLFIIQATLVIALTRMLHWPLSYMRQPRVIAEVITGIVLGPSVMGRIDRFSQHIFPTASMPAFSLAANIGLVLFLFLVGLEVDIRFLLSNWRIALSVGALGMALPFGLGVGIAWGLYHQFRNEPNIEPISFGVYALFIGVALAITAFPVLCRILVSLKLLSTPVGVIVLSAGVGNDVVGWILLALCVTLVNSGAGLTALWIFLAAIGYCLFLAYAVKPAFWWVLRRTGSFENGPTQGVVALTLLLVLASAFFTNIIGIHAIFGAFMVGLICPHQGGFAIKLAEKIEDLVAALFLPLYFALSGLNTNLGLLDSGITWAYVVGVTAIAFVGKVVGGTIAARLNGLVWRESLTIGCFMSCKGLVELIVLNIGLQARILSTRTFTIFVVMALVTTFATTPLVVWLYPPWYQEKLELWKKGKINWDGTPIAEIVNKDSDEDSHTDVAGRIMVYLRTDGLSSLFTILALLTGSRQHARQDAARRLSLAEKQRTEGREDSIRFERPLRIHGLRLMELTERNSSVMKVSELEDYANRDPIIKAFGSSVHSAARDVTMTGQIAVVPDHSFADTLVQRATSSRSHFLLVPWSETGSMSEIPSSGDHAPLAVNADPLQNKDFTALVHNVFEEAHNSCAVGVFIDRSLVKTDTDSTNTIQPSSPVLERATRQLSRTYTNASMLDFREDAGMVFKSGDSSGRPQIRVLYTGSVDDLYAVKLALQLANNGGVDVRIIHVLDSTTTSSKNNFSMTKKHTSTPLEDLKHSLTELVKPHVVFEEMVADSGSNTEVLNALLVNKSDESDKSGDVTVFVGRNVTASVPGTPTPLPISTVLGSVTTSLMAQMKSLKLAASLLVVQGKVSSGAHRERRQKGLGISEDSIVEA